MYYKDAQAVILAFSLTRMDSFDALDNWISEVREKSQENNYVKVIIGSKCDLMGQEVPYSKGSKYAKENGAMYFETSAKSGHHVNEVFQQIANSLFTLEQTGGFSKRRETAQKLDKKKKKRKNKKKGCC